MRPIQKHMMNMFIALRWDVGVVGILLPLVLGFVGYLGFKIPLSGSMGAYYHATQGCGGKLAQEALRDPRNAPVACMVQGTGPLRNWFVGSLCFIEREIPPCSTFLDNVYSVDAQRAIPILLLLTRTVFLMIIDPEATLPSLPR